MLWTLIGIIVFVILFLAFPRIIIGTVVFLIVGAIGVFAVLVAMDRQQASLQRSVSVTIEYNRNTCTTELFPLLVTVTNNSNKTVLEVRWNLVARRPGHSSNVFASGYNERSTDKILKPGKGVANCYSVPKLKLHHSPQKLEYSAESVRSKFR